ncbi:MAG: nuclease-related domain-containing protein [Chloroflexota bacterium]|jgi:hypothetical protein
MIVYRDDERIENLKKRGQRVSIVGFLFLLGGFVLVFITVQYLILFQLIALVGGFILTQYGLYLQHRYARSPRPDEVIDDAIKSVARDGVMYHYILPAPHVLLTPSGPIVFNLKYQIGVIQADGDKWSQKGLGFRRFFGQEGLGNPTNEVEKMIKGLAGFISRNAPDVEEVPIGAMIVFTSKNQDELDVSGSRIPAMHFSKVKGYLRQKGAGQPLPQEDYDALRAAFDEAAGDLVS